ncbi:hypothetical protein OHC33_008340 [Knufia fluminis]|uniref:Uncharacterized protein n=1 Tax=Knufia fluminis TaxID=191047 RepID=A0AAN8EB33_9EURO|nr:hypothetical protein OHC33_008340 [Knufia fluminis]
MSKNRWRYFRWTPRTALITFMYVGFFPGLLLYGFGSTDTAVKDPSINQAQKQEAADTHEHASDTAVEAAAKSLKTKSTTTSKHETEAGAKALDTHKEGTKCTSCDSIKNTRDLDGEGRDKPAHKQCTSCASGITNPPTASKESVREQWNPSAFRPLKEIDNGGRLGRGFKAS